MVLWLKRRRRNRRRNADRVSNRIAGGWDEYVDTARDIGAPVPAIATRREKALLIRANESLELAYRADRAVFDAADPDRDQVEAYWAAVERARRALRKPLSLRRRITSRLSLVSLRSPNRSPRTETGRGTHSLPTGARQ